MNFLLFTFLIGITVTSGQPLCRTYAAFPTYEGECAEKELKLFSRCVERELQCQTIGTLTGECNLCYEECMSLSLLVSNHRDRRYRLRKAAFRCKDMEEKLRIHSCESRENRCTQASWFGRLETCAKCARDCIYQMKFLSDSRAFQVIETADACAKSFWKVCKMYEGTAGAPPAICSKQFIDYEFKPPIY